jgi:hypothetical protein
MRAIDREAKRAESRRLAYEKAAQRMEALEEAADAAAEYEDMLDQLTGAHRVTFKRLDWAGTAERELLAEPLRSMFLEERAQKALADYSPGWFARTFGLAASHRRKLETQLRNAILGDQEAFDLEMRRVSATNAKISFARRMMEHDREAFIDALTKQTDLGKLPFCVEGVDVVFTAEGPLIIRVDGLDVEDLPTQSVSLLQSGKASVKPLSSARIMELHRDNLCSSALRVAIECLQVLPVEQIEVTMLTDILDRGTGHIAPQPVLHVKLSTQAIDVLNLARADAAAVVERLGGTMSWSKKDGFRPIELESAG